MSDDGIGLERSPNRFEPSRRLGQTLTNDNWRTGGQEAEIQASGLAPTDDRESALVVDLNPGNYTAIVRGVNALTGVALVEAYDLN